MYVKITKQYTVEYYREYKETVEFNTGKSI